MTMQKTEATLMQKTEAMLTCSSLGKPFSVFGSPNQEACCATSQKWWVSDCFVIMLASTRTFLSCQFGGNFDCDSSTKHALQTACRQKSQCAWNHQVFLSLDFQRDFRICCVCCCHQFDMTKLNHGLAENFPIFTSSQISLDKFVEVRMSFFAWKRVPQ